MLLCEGSRITVNKCKILSLPKPKPAQVMEQLQAKAARQRAYKARDLTLEPDFSLSWSNGSNPIRFSERSISRLANVVGIPLGLIRAESIRGKRACNRITEMVNERLGDLNEGYTAVIDSDTVEGILSPKYKRLPNDVLAGFVLDHTNMETHEVSRLVVEETRMALDISSLSVDTMPEQRVLLKLNDPIRAGMSVFNSEDADAAVDVSTFVERLRCLNGATISERNRAGRVQHTGEHFFQRLGEVMGRVRSSTARVFTNLPQMRSIAISAEEHEALVGAFSDMFSAKMSERIMEDAAANVDETPGELVETKKPDPFRRADGQLVSVFNVWNGITFQGHEASSLNRRRSLEAYGGLFLTNWPKFVSLN